jgi:hypothetical protein
MDTASPEGRKPSAAIFEENLPASGRRIAFPILTIDDEVLIGFHEEKFRNALKI